MLLGQFRDPLLGRDALIGITAATVLIAISKTVAVLVRSKPAVSNAFLTGMRQGIGGVFSVITFSFVTAVGIYVFMFVLRVITRRDWIAAAVFVILNSLPIMFLLPEKAWLVGTVSLIANTIAMILLFRFGIVVLLAWNFAALLLASAPLTLHVSAWYGSSALFGAAALLAVTIYAFRVALAGRPLFNEALLET